MKANFLLNGHNVGYLIHGQVFEMQYKISGCLFVIVSNKGKGMLQFRKAQGKYIGLSNAYSPNVSFWAFGFGIKRYTHRLKVNFMNTKISVPFTKYPKPKSNIDFSLPKFNLSILRPINKPELLSMPQQKELNLILNNEHSLSLYEKVKNEYK
jgi:hypothetical protein